MPTDTSTPAQLGVATGVTHGEMLSIDVTSLEESIGHLGFNMMSIIYIYIIIINNNNNHNMFSSNDF